MKQIFCTSAATYREVKYQIRQSAIQVR